MKSFWGRRWSERLAVLFVFLLFGLPPIAGLLFALAAGVGALWDLRSNYVARSSAEKSLAAAERTRLHRPAEFQAFSAADAGAFLVNLATGRGEEEQFQVAERSAAGLRVEQPRRIGAGRSEDVVGVGVRDVEGDFEMKTCLDLKASALKAKNTSLYWAGMIDWEARYQVVLRFEPGPSELRCGDGLRVLKVPPQAGSFCVWLERRQTDFALSAAVGVEGARERLCALSGPRTRPARQVEVGVTLGRPPGSPVAKEFLTPARDVYVLAPFSVTCLDPAGCRARAD